MVFHWTFPIIVILGIASVSEGFAANYARLQRDLFQSYRKVIPISDAGGPVDVHIEVSLLSIVEVGENTNEVAIEAWVFLRWNSRNAWSPNEYANITSIAVPSQQLWAPDITVYNHIGKLENGSPDLAVISSSGEVMWVPKWSIRTMCSKDGDGTTTTTCILKFGSWVHNQHHIDLKTSSNSVDMSNYFDGSKNQIFNATYKRNVMYYSCCPEPFVDVQLIITFGEKALGNVLDRVRSFFWN